MLDYPPVDRSFLSYLEQVPTSVHFTDVLALECNHWVDRIKKNEEKEPKKQVRQERKQEKRAAKEKKAEVREDLTLAATSQLPKSRRQI